MLAIIDNFDSFTYNLVQYFGELGQDIKVFRNNAISVNELEKLNPEKILISPGPCTPDVAGISLEVIQSLGSKIPILGVCLGHQSIGQAYGGKVIAAPYMMHGKTSEIKHNNTDILEGLSNPFTATRYHSLIVERKTLPDCLQITAETDDGIIMAMKHKEHPVFGLQFHPESILTTEGKSILKNFLEK